MLGRPDPRDRSFPELLSLCLRSTCPVCARGRLFVSRARARSPREHFLPARRCDSCGFEFTREPGYFLGAITPVLQLLALGFAAAVGGLSYAFAGARLPEVLYVGAAAAALGLLVFSRTAVAVFIAIDHALDPPRRRTPDRVSRRDRRGRR